MPTKVKSKKSFLNSVKQELKDFLIRIGFHNSNDAYIIIDGDEYDRYLFSDGKLIYKDKEKAVIGFNVEGNKYN